MVEACPHHAGSQIKQAECHKSGDTLAAWVGVLEWIVEAVAVAVVALRRAVDSVAVAVVALRRARELHIWVGAEEPTKHRVVKTAVHVDDAELRQHFMTRVAATQTYGVGADGLLAPGIVFCLEYIVALMVEHR